MDALKLCIRKLLFLIYLFSQLSNISSELISLCHHKTYEITCISDQYIVIKYSKLGHLPYLDNLNYNKSGWCLKSHSFNKTKTNECIKSLSDVIGNECTGRKSCKPDLVPAKYLMPNEVICDEFDDPSQEMSFYIEYECISKNLFFEPQQIGKIHFVGGYMKSVGYLEQKNADHDSFKELAVAYETKSILPIKRVLRPPSSRTLNGKSYIFQFQIIENSLSSKNKSEISDICKIGKLYSQDYYSFTATNKTQSANQKSLFSVCEIEDYVVGQIFGPIIANQITIDVNVNFSSITGGVLLIKFTIIVCPPIVAEYADVIYDHVIHNDQNLDVRAVAIITCRKGFVFPSLYNDKSGVSSKTIQCNDATGIWQNAQLSYTCVNELSINSKTSTVTRAVTTYTSIVYSSQYFSESLSVTNISTFLDVTSDSSILTKINLARYVVPVLLSLVLICALLLFLFWKFRNKSKCLQSLINTFPKNGSIQTAKFFTNSLSYSRNSHTFIFEDSTHGMDTFNPFTGTLSPYASCRQSNRTLTTTAGSRPTIISGDSMHASNYIYESEPNQSLYEDELPTKLPKASTLTRIKRSANSSFMKIRPKSLSRGSYIDRSSNLSFGKFSSSQIPLLSSKRPQFVDSTSVMCTSDILPSNDVNRNDVSLRKKYSSRPCSQSEISYKLNNNGKVISPTVDTYLEPTDSLMPQSEEFSDGANSTLDKERKHSDYMIYDHSRMSSTNPDTTCQSSVIASLSDETFNGEDNKNRFSMISNQYYGLQGAKPRDSQNPFINSLNNIQCQTSSNSNEYIYESIDDDDMMQGTIDRRHLALPKPPSED